MGNGPWSKLWERSRKYNEFTSLDIELGIEPCRLFDERSRVVRFTSLDIELGIEPCNILFLKSRYSKEWLYLNSPISPMNWLWSRVNLTKDVKLNNQDGSVPFRKFELKERSIRRFKPLTWLGRGPTSWLFWRYKAERFGKSNIDNGNKPVEFTIIKNCQFDVSVKNT